ncbi:MAG TPA: FliH/SctL family protein [Burkholderiaceae bacterium]|nr:FliH/SctL family protein [Burkholderiaceae bacterium]
MPSSSSRIVFAEDLVGATPWRPSAIEGTRPPGPERRSGAERREAPPAPAPTYEDGLRDGYARGLEAARREAADAMGAEIARIAAGGDALLAAFTAELARVQGELAADVTALAVEIARSAVGVALKVREDVVGAAVAGALESIVGDHARPQVRVSPEDAARLAERLEPLLAARGAQLVPDASVAPGGCVVETPRAEVDATVRTRWQRALAAIGRDDDWIGS